jgi:type I restriction enzyme M protein
VATRVRQQLLEECNLHTIIKLPNSVFKPYATVGTNLLFFSKGEPTQEIWYYEHKVPSTQKSYSKTKPILIEHLNPIKEWWGGESRLNRQENENAWLVPIEKIRERKFDLDVKNPNTVEEEVLNHEEALLNFQEMSVQFSTAKAGLTSLLKEAFSK